MKSRTWFVVVAGLVAGPMAASGQESVQQQPTSPQLETGTSVYGDSYVGARFGVIVPKSSDLDGFDNGFAFEGTVGHRVNPNIALEMSVGYYTLSASASGGGLSASADVSAIPVVGTMKVIAPLDRVDLYGLVGAGAYFISSELSASGYYSGNATDDGTSLGLTVGGGLTARLSPQFSLGAEVKYLIGSVKLFDEDMNYDSLVIGGLLNLRF